MKSDQMTSIIIVWMVQAIIAAVINYHNVSRIPRGILDFLILTFAPYVFYCYLFNKKNLE